jgi:hypothetical protein
MNTMLDARMVAARTHRLVDEGHGDVHGAARIAAASETGDGNEVIAHRRLAIQSETQNVVHDA